MRRRIIALSGKKGSGKDTIGNVLEGHSYTRLAFADELKGITAFTYNITSDDLFVNKNRPLESLPVDPQDMFSLSICRLMFREFRTLTGHIAETCHRDGLTGRLLGTVSGKNYQLYWTPRALCILEGSTKRAVSPSFWTQAVIEQIKYFPDTSFVITDLRYKSEARQLRETFGEDLLLVRVNRQLTSLSTDPSETDLDNYEFDLIINNFRSLEELAQQVEEKLL